MNGILATIRVNYAQARACAQKLANAADDCGRMRRSMSTAANGIPSSWTGEAATAFTAELQKWQKESQAIERELDQLAALIRRVADEFEEAERRLQAAANAVTTTTTSKTGAGNNTGKTGTENRNTGNTGVTLDLNELVDDLTDFGKNLLDKFF